jgi:hypothetical protein
MRQRIDQHPPTIFTLSQAHDYVQVLNKDEEDGWYYTVSEVDVVTTRDRAIFGMDNYAIVEAYEADGTYIGCINNPPHLGEPKICMLMKYD